MSILNVNLVQTADVVTRSPWVDVKAYGIQLQASILLAITNIGSDNRTVLLAPGTWDISTNLIIPSNITLRIECGAVVNIQSGITLTIDGNLEAGLYKIFDGDGQVVFRYGSIKESHPEWWGAKADGVTDCTVAIQSAVDSCPTCCLSSGTYVISDIINTTISWPSGSTLYGQGANATFILQTYRWLGIINNSTALTFYGCSLDWNGNPEDGAVSIYSTGFGSSFHNFLIQKCYTGLEIAGTSNQKASMFSIYGHRNMGIYVHDTTNFICNEFYVDGADKDETVDNTLRGIEGGIHITNSASEIKFSNGIVKNGAWGLVADKTTGTVPKYCTFTDVSFMDYYFSSNIDELQLSNFTDCHFTGGRYDTGYDGCILTTTDSVSFMNTRFSRCGGHGCFVSATSLRSVFNGCRFESNSVTADSGTCHGLNIVPATTHFIVTNCVATNSAIAGGRQGYGIMIEEDTGSPPVNCDYYVVTNNVTYGNVTGGIHDGGTTASKKSVTSNVPDAIA